MFQEIDNICRERRRHSILSQYTDHSVRHMLIYHEPTTQLHRFSYKKITQEMELASERHHTAAALASFTGAESTTASGILTYPTFLGLTSSASSSMSLVRSRREVRSVERGRRGIILCCGWRASSAEASGWFWLGLSKTASSKRMGLSCLISVTTVTNPEEEEEEGKRLRETE
ncbi:hypothetical protein RchiOBHm_Chr3g0487711 [Rosa chinensis]|uniref:Uncharacterized protein n=1 Tax=Rosa chinensis TaxID=74649 RepID=A0A2P6RFM8_ROSCH|nr:hypothetical protein RchiOBHm_Chr3g0487711 [Rosa chinensis]